MVFFVAQGAVVVVVTVVAVSAAVSGARHARRFGLARTDGPTDLLRAGAPAGADHLAVTSRRAERTYSGKRIPGSF